MRGPRENRQLASLILELFQQTADEDYLAARWAWFANQNYLFNWHAQQAIEKFSKCALLLNDFDISDKSHDIRALWAELKDHADGIIPILFTPPNCMSIGPYGAQGNIELFMDLIERINSNGSPANRYNTYATTVHQWDLHKFDELIFQLRRICVCLELPFYRDLGTFSDYLKRDPNFQPHKFSFSTGEVLDGQCINQHMIQKRNFSFYPNEARQNGDLTLKTFSKNSPIYNTSKYSAGAEAIEWLKSHANFNRYDKKFLDSLVAKD